VDREAPGVSILRPLKGCDSETESCLRSWFDQSYGGKSELLFGVASENDPVCEIVRRLIQEYPEQPAELAICKPILGANAKVSSLCYLAKRASHELMVVSDQDVLISRDFLSELVLPLGQKEVGLVNCFYILANPQGAGMWLEAVAVNADFWSQVLQGNMLKPMDFALGAVMVTTKSRIEVIGGFEGLLDYLADDYQLGNRIAKTGARLEICPVPVECRSERQSARAVWKHQLRWGRTIRVCQPAPYFFSILSNATVWPVLGLMGTGTIGVGVLGCALVLRVVTAISNYRRLTGETRWRAGFLAPIKDLLQVAIWALAFAGNEITWRDQRFRVEKGGKLTPLA
jgi:ceramide glucosyltransferase